MNEEWLRQVRQQISAEFCNEVAVRLDEAIRRNMMDASTTKLPSWGPIMRDGSPADPEKFGIAAIDCAIPEDQLAEMRTAVRARNAASVRMESKTYPDGTTAFGPAPLPDVSPALWAKPLAKEVQGVTVSLTELGLENEIQAKADNGPRVTPADIEASIASEHYFTAADGVTGAKFNAEPRQTVGIDTSPLPLHLLTFCVLVLRNGFTVTGESACASPENFNAEIGRKVARSNAVQKIWPLLGFRLRDELVTAQC